MSATRAPRPTTTGDEETRGDAARGRLAEAVLDHFLAGGSPEGSLRSIATAVEVSHSLLLYHFHSLPGVLAAVHLACERREREHLAALQITTEDPVGVMELMWRHLAEQRMWPVYRVGFALRLRAGVDVETARAERAAWSASVRPLASALGFDGDRAGEEALLWVATCRGLLWELITGAEPVLVHRAADRFFARYR